MHQKLTKHGRFCKQNNQLPTKSHDELEDYSNVFDNFLAEITRSLCIMDRLGKIN